MKLEDTVSLMSSEDYGDRFLAEYHQTKIRYDKLTAMLNNWDAYLDWEECHPHSEECLPLGCSKTIEDFIGYRPDNSYRMYKQQQDAMRQYLHCLEVRAATMHLSLEPGDLCFPDASSPTPKKFFPSKAESIHEYITNHQSDFNCDNEFLIKAADGSACGLVHNVTELEQIFMDKFIRGYYVASVELRKEFADDGDFSHYLYILDCARSDKS